MDVDSKNTWLYTNNTNYSNKSPYLKGVDLLIQKVLFSRKLKIACLLFILFAFTVFAINGGDPFEPEESDFSGLSWTESFSLLHKRMSEEYAFTEWKGIEWDTLWKNTWEKVVKAQQNTDFDAFYIAIREYLHAIPDGHVSCTNLDEIDKKFTGAGFGFSISKVVNGRIIVTWVDEGSSAWLAGLRPEAELLEWNGVNALEALSDVSTVFTGNSATIEDLELKKALFLVRAPAGTLATITFIDKNSVSPKTISLLSFEDEGITYKKSYPKSIVSDGLRDAFIDNPNPDPLPESMVETAVLEEKILYIKIWGELDADLTGSGNAPSTLDLFRNAVYNAIVTPYKGIIIDLRNNIGGLDEMAAAILGSFYSKTTFYEYLFAYNKYTKTRELITTDVDTASEALFIRPAHDYYYGRVIALVNSKCVSSGEGIAMGIRNLPNGDTLGFFGTNGSFGLSGSSALIPGSLTIRWPSGQSLDINKRIQLDSQNGVGGVPPSIRIPMTVTNAIRVANGEDVELEEAVRYLLSK
jgi:carboxyl-terminal processing protease